MEGNTKQYCGRVLIPYEELQLTHQSSGNCEARFYSDGAFDLEASAPVTDLPCEMAEILIPDLPLDITDPDLDIGVNHSSTIRINNIHGDFYENIGTCCDVYIDGEIVGYKPHEDETSRPYANLDVIINLLDEDGNIVEEYSGEQRIMITAEEDGTFVNEDFLSLRHLDNEMTYTIEVKPAE